MEDKPMPQNDRLLTADAGHIAPANRIRGAAQTNLPFLCIAIPALNEAHYIEACLLSLLAQWPEGALEILVMDGGSQDDTAQIVAEVAQSHPSVRARPWPWLKYCRASASRLRRGKYTTGSSRLIQMRPPACTARWSNSASSLWVKLGS
ncbi:MAG: glycosyltransferase [Rhodospirillales bacterium]|nr:glycosyltransferase [Rhodospirillales bacterium]